jgi:hypothetical protein
LLPLSNFADNLTGKVANAKYYFIDNGIISLLALDIRTSLLENLIAVHLVNKYGKNAAYYYNHGVEVDFYVPDEKLAVQVCYAMRDAETLERETRALVKLNEHIKCERNVIVTYEDEDTLTAEGINIDVVPAWKFILRGVISTS